MTELDEIREKLYMGESEFVTALQSADKSDKKLRIAALERLNALYIYASIKGRGRFLDEMRLPGVETDLKVAHDACEKSGKSAKECDALINSIPLVQSLFDAWPATNSPADWWSAPLTHLIGTYDQSTPPSDELDEWRDQVKSPPQKDEVEADADPDTIDDDLAKAVDDAKPKPMGIPWWKVAAAAVGLGVVTGTVVHIARR